MKTVIATIAAAIAILTLAAPAQAVTRCQWEGYGSYKQWVCRDSAY